MPSITKTCYYIHGKPNTGKTHLSCGIARELAKQGYGAVRVKEVDFVTLYNLYKYRQPDAIKLDMQNAILADLLIWDDLNRAMEAAGHDCRAAIFSIFEARAEKRRPNIITTKYSMQDIIEAYGDDFLRRVLQKQGKQSTHIIHSTGA